MKLGDHKQHYGIDLFIFLPSTISLMFLWSATPPYLSQYFSHKAQTGSSSIPEQSCDYSFSCQREFSSLRVLPLEPLLPPSVPLTCHHGSVWGPQWERRKQRRDFLLLFVTLGVLFPAFGPIREDSHWSHSHILPLYTSGFLTIFESG